MNTKTIITLGTTVLTAIALLFVSAVVTQVHAFGGSWGGPWGWGGWNDGYPYVNCRIFILSPGPCL